MSGDFDQPNLVAALLDFPWTAPARLRPRERDEINGCRCFAAARQIPFTAVRQRHEKTAVISTFGHWDAMIPTDGVGIILDCNQSLLPSTGSF